MVKRKKKKKKKKKCNERRNTWSIIDGRRDEKRCVGHQSTAETRAYTILFRYLYIYEFHTWFLDGKPLHQPLDEIVTHESRRNWGEKLFLAAHGYPVLRVLHLPHQPLHLVEGARPVNAWLLFLLLIIRGLHRDRGGPLRRWQELWRYRWRRGLGSWAGDGSTRTPWGSSPIPSLQSPPHAHRRFRAV